MRVLIVAKTRRGTGACVGGLTQDGQSVRLVAADAERNEHAGLEYNVGEVWEIESTPDPAIIPPHVENIIVLAARRLKRIENLEEIIQRFVPPVAGGWEKLFEGRLQATPAGGLFVAKSTGLPLRSTMFWTPDQPLHRDVEGKRIRYRYATDDGGRTLTFVGFQEPIEVIPAGALLRVSLAHWWKPKDAPPEEVLRCHLQLSGWFLPEQSSLGLVIQVPGRSPKCVSGPTSPAPDLDSVHHVLKHTFGFGEFLPLQEDIVVRLLQRRDTLVIMPTGGGKSLCYQLPALLRDGLTVVVSPLIALMQDQVNQLHQLAVRAAFLNSTLALREYTSIASRVRSGEVRILYVAPETLLRPETLVLLEQSRLACIAVDEAHCISEWGHDFRPEYRQLQQVRRRFPQAVCVALTATATPRVREDICRLLRIKPDGEFVASFDRPNLFLSVQPRRDGLRQALAFLEQHKAQSGITYCSTKKQVDKLAAELVARGWPALPYHAGMDAESRRENQDNFIRDDATIMVATVAFGMGINKSNVRFVLHFNLPRDIESYYQEIGRSGRDGLPADCLLLHSRADAITIRKFIDEGAMSEAAGRQARLEAMVRYAETAGCRRVPLLGYFGETLTWERRHPAGACPDHDDSRADKVSALPGASDADETARAHKAVRALAGPGIGGVPALAGKVPALPGEPAHCGHCDNCRAGQRAVELADLTDAARNFLFCIQRTGECFGPTHIIDVLRGSKSQRVLNRHHDRLPVYGTGREFSGETWRDLVNQFIEQGLAEQDLQFGGLRLGAKAEAVLSGENVFVRRKLTPEVVTRAETAPKEHDPELFEQLRRKRRELADQAGVPAYVIFSDRALVEMATHLPRTPAQFLDINGVGESKLANYGETFLQLIRDYCVALGIPEAAPAIAPLPAPGNDEPMRWLTTGRRHEEIGDAFAAGAMLDELETRFAIQRGTILQHLQRYRDAGNRFDPERVLANCRLSAAERARALAAFHAHGHEWLGPVHDALGGSVPYEELHVLRLYLTCRA